MSLLWQLQLEFLYCPLWQVSSMFIIDLFYKPRLKRKCWWVNNLLSARMAAMHWEARRRQSLLDRRTARDKRQVGLALRPGRCQHLSFFEELQRRRADGDLAGRCSTLLLKRAARPGIWAETPTPRRGVRAVSCGKARRLYPVADFQDLLKHRKVV